MWTAAPAFHLSFLPPSLPPAKAANGTNAAGDESGEDNLDSSLDVHPLETSDDDLSRRPEGDLKLGTTRMPQGGGENYNTSTPKGPCPPASRGRPDLPPPPQPHFPSPSRPPASLQDPHPSPPPTTGLSSPSTPSMNRSFPRPTQSVSPEFPLESPRESEPEDDGSIGVDESELSMGESYHGLVVSTIIF